MKKLLIVLAAVFALTGCATLLGGGANQAVSVNASPSNAVITITAQSGQVVYEGAPSTVTLPRKNSYSVAIKLDGYKTETVSITQGLNGWFIGNLCFGGPIGALIDFFTGSMWELQPNQISLTLKTALIKGENGPAIVFFTRDANGELRSIIVPLVRA